MCLRALLIGSAMITCMDGYIAAIGKEGGVAGKVSAASATVPVGKSFALADPGKTGRPFSVEFYER